MRVMLICRIMSINDIGSRFLDYTHVILDNLFVAAVLNLLGGITQQQLRGILADVSGFLLLDNAHGLHFLIGIIGVKVVSRASRSVCGNDSGKPFIFSTEAFQNAVHGHKLYIVVVGRYGKMRGTLKIFFAVRKKYFRILVVQLHIAFLLVCLFM